MMWIIGSLLLWFLNLYYYVKDEVDGVWRVLRIRMKSSQKLNSKDVVHLAIRTNDLVQFDYIALSQLIELVKEQYNVKYLTIVARKNSIKLESFPETDGIKFYINHQEASSFRGEVQLSVNLIEQDSKRLMLKKWQLSSFSDSRISSKAM